MNSLKIVYDTRFIYPAQIVELNWSPSYTENSKWKDVKNTIGKPIQDLNSALRLLNMDLVTVSKKQLDFARAARIKVIEHIFADGLYKTLDIYENNQYFELLIYYSLSGSNLFDRDDVVYVTPDDFNYYLGVWYVFDKMYELGINDISLKLTEDSNIFYGIYSPQFWIECAANYDSNDKLSSYVYQALTHYLNTEVLQMNIHSYILESTDAFDLINSIYLSYENTNIFYDRCLKELRSSKSFCKQITNIHKLHSLDVFDMFTDVEYAMESIRIKYRGGKKKHVVNLV